LVVGADIAPAMLRPARSRLTVPAFQPVVADGQMLPFLDGIFDAVICHLGLQFFPDPGQGLAEFRRVLRSLTIGTPSKRGPVSYRRHTWRFPNPAAQPFVGRCGLASRNSSLKGGW